MGIVLQKKEHHIKIYNPFSVLLFLKTGEFSNYWFETGTPTFLINLLKIKNYPIQNFEKTEASEGELKSFEIEDIDLKTLLFQTGYITIKRYDTETNNYILGYPNKECIDSLSQRIIKSMTTIQGANSTLS